MIPNLIEQNAVMKRKQMKRYCLLVLLIPIVGYTNTISSPGKAIVIGDSSRVFTRTCYYQDKAYSLGAILQVGSHYMVCTEEKKHESNGALRWAPLDQEHTEKSSQPSYQRQ